MGTRTGFIRSQELMLETHSALGFTHFIAQSDTLGKAILFVLVAMSIVTWYWVVMKTATAVLARQRSARFLAQFRTLTSVAALERAMQSDGSDEPFSNIASHALAAARHLQSTGGVERKAG